MSRPTRPGSWAQVWNLFWDSFSRQPKKRYVGEDHFGNKYYQYERGTKGGNVQRGYESPNGDERPQPLPVEWRSWLNMARRFPPSEEEIRLNMQKQQAQLTQDAETERRAPTVDSKGIGAGDMDKRRKWSTDFPKYEEGQYELHPGAKKQSELDKEERERRKRDPGDDH